DETEGQHHKEDSFHGELASIEKTIPRSGPTWPRYRRGQKRGDGLEVDRGVVDHLTVLHTADALEVVPGRGEPAGRGGVRVQQAELLDRAVAHAELDDAGVLAAEGVPLRLAGQAPRGTGGARPHPAH